MIFARRFAFFALVGAATLVPFSAFAKRGSARARESTAGTGVYKGYIVMDAASGRVLAQENADVLTPPASMTKLMTFAVLHDKLAAGALTLSTPVKVEADDADMGGTQVYLDPKETFPVEELIYAMMIQSANDAAHALARVAAGSVPGFVELMNAKARELGMTHTTFRSPHGLPPHTRRIADGDLTSPRDFAILSRYLLTNTDVLKYTSVTTRDFGPLRPKGPQHMINHNKLLGRVAGVDGLKTGYTEGAGYCLSATAQRNGHRVIGVIMGAFGPNGQIDKGRARDRKMIELLEKGFAAIPASEPPFTPAAGGKVAAPSPVSVAPMSADEKEAGQPEEDTPSIKFEVPGQPKRK
jgi:D-alanyl-D-alanine carboxypeptidase (penicillin-binding protein 5/6)